MLRFLKHVGTLIKLLQPVKLQKIFTEVSYIETLKSPIKRKLSYVSIYSSINEFQESGFEMEFLFGLYDLLNPNLGGGRGAILLSMMVFL